ncbi:MAG: hypothetical protein TH68_02615 [Candidatus Synechococcus spongiarum 142]|uniref:Uncharacterized protein n=1 Tax=Candidatus Synechococcus spongiarum 142 TaxID=1608213 RepID=A0A6N3X638_9SYNE|nr:MAG: hypothetical protein TH68_02615 [Candidatus Synechococcus spongiarum 142]
MEKVSSRISEETREAQLEGVLHWGIYGAVLLALTLRGDLPRFRLGLLGMALGSGTWIPAQAGMKRRG